MPKSLQPGGDSKLMAHKQPTSNLPTSSKTQDHASGHCTFPSGVSQKEEGRRTLPHYKVQPTPVCQQLQKEKPHKTTLFQSIH